MTVSRVLNGKGRASEATKKRIFRATERLNYRRDPILSAVMSQIRSNRGIKIYTAIGILLQSDTAITKADWKIDRLLKGIDRAAKNLNLTLMRFSYQEDPDHIKEIARLMEARGIRTCLILPTETSLIPWTKLMPKQQLVMVGNHCLDPEVSRVASDDYTNMLMLLRKIAVGKQQTTGLVLHEGRTTTGQQQALTAYNSWKHLKDDQLIPALRLNPQEPDLARKWLVRHSPDQIILGGYDPSMLRLLEQLASKPFKKVFCSLGPDQSGEMGLIECLEHIGEISIRIGLKLQTQNAISKPQTVLLPGYL